jgi:hypothetical protein
MSVHDFLAFRDRLADHPSLREGVERALDSGSLASLIDLGAACGLTFTTADIDSALNGSQGHEGLRPEEADLLAAAHGSQSSLQDRKALGQVVGQT